MLFIIQDEVLLYKEKSIMWCNNLKQQKQVEFTLCTVNIDIRIFHTKLNHNEQ